jgi:hypothetical protein
LFRDEQFKDLFAIRGRPAWSPGRLALVRVSQFVEGPTDRQAAADAGHRVLDGILRAARDNGLLPGRGKARTDSTHVLSAAREVTFPELVAETLRTALNALAQVVPNWLTAVAEPDWFKHCSTRAEDARFPKTPAKREEIGRRIATDSVRLLDLLTSPDVPAALGEPPQITTLRQVWAQQFHLVDGALRQRETKDRPPGAQRLMTPYDTEARGSVKRETV